MCEDSYPLHLPKASMMRLPTTPPRKLNAKEKKNNHHPIKGPQFAVYNLSHREATLARFFFSTWCCGRPFSVTIIGARCCIHDIEP